MVNLWQLSFACFFIRMAFLAIIREISCVPSSVRTEGAMALLVAAAASSDQATNYSFMAPPVEWTTTHSARHRRRRRRRRDPISNDDEIDRLKRHMDHLHDRAFCMWTYGVSVDENRQPSHLPYARCLNTTLEGFAQTCQHVLYRVPVLKRNVSLGVDSWEKRHEWVRVGCTLANPKLHHLPRPPTYDRPTTD